MARSAGRFQPRSPAADADGVEADLGSAGVVVLSWVVACAIWGLAVVLVVRRNQSENRMLILVLMFVGVLGGLGAAAVRQLPAPSMGWLASGGGLITLALIWRGVEVSDFTFT